MATTTAVRVHNYCGEEVAITNFFTDGQMTKRGRCVIDVNGEEAEVDIESLLDAVLAMEVVNGTQ